MPMVDIFATKGTFADPRRLAIGAASAVKDMERVPDLPMFRKNTAAFVHELAEESWSNIEGESNYVRVQVLTNAGALDRDKQVQLARALTDLICIEANDPTLSERTWVILTEASPGGWGLWGHAHTNEELVAAARAEIAKAGKT